MAEKLIALQDISDTIKTGDRFEAPDRILVAMGLAVVDPGDVVEAPPAPVWRRRGRGRQSS